MQTIFGFDTVFETRVYPSGEWHIIAKTAPADVIVYPNAFTFDDLMKVVVADGICRRVYGTRPRWFIPFFPFARDDRRQTQQDGMELQAAIDLLRDLDVVILDPHSDVAGQLPHIPQKDVVALHNFSDLENPAFLIPDDGATKKAHTWLDPTHPLILQGHKRRDPKTGALSGFTVDVPPCGDEPFDVVIVDDICQGGGTFLGLLDALDDEIAFNTAHLVVTHLLATKDQLDVLFYHFDTIRCAGPCADSRVKSIKYSSIWDRGIIS